MEKRVKDLWEEGSKLFSNRQALDSFWQEVALQFYPEVANFTVQRDRGQDFTDHLTTSYPIIARRTLGDSFSSLLRPSTLDNTAPGVWFSMRTDRPDQEDRQSKAWLEWATGQMRRAMYDRSSGFVRAAKEGDHHFAAFGQAPLSLEFEKGEASLLYRCWHLRDVAWSENASGNIDRVFRKWRPTVSMLQDVFGDKVSPRVKDQAEKDPHKHIDVMHVMISTEAYGNRGLGNKKYRTPWISLWVDHEHDHVMEDRGSWSNIYIIPRWVTVPGSPYASSPAVTAALPDARLMQAMTLTMLEAGEKFADPPMLATQEAIRSDIALWSGGVTWTDAEYDERLGRALTPVYDSKAGQGLGVALELTAQVREQISRAFYLDSLSLPPADVRNMTAFETAQRISEWTRRAMPIFEPLESEFNGRLCEETFSVLMRNGLFGNVDDIPQQLRGRDIQFKFESPLHESADRRKGHKFVEAKEALAQAAEIDPSVLPMIDAAKSLRDVLDGIGVPADWTRDKATMDQMKARQEAEQAAMSEMGTAVEGATAAANVAQKLGSASRDFAAAQGGI